MLNINERIIHGLLNSAVSSSDYDVSDERMI
jgi:hypothetical protein